MSQPQEQQGLVRGLGLRQATALNMIDMVGIGPFITISFVVGAMHGPHCIVAWLLGAFLSMMDGCVWAELGAKWPQAGGSYVFLQHLYGKKWGKYFAFLYIWQTTIQAPLVIASGAIGFSEYLGYLVPLSKIGAKAVSGSLVLLLTFVLYRNIKDLGKISVLMWLVVGGTILWIIITGILHFDAHLAFTYPENAFSWSSIFFFGLGQASIKTIYSFLGYYNVCHLGGEIEHPERNIPRSMFISIISISLLYLGMQLAVLGVVPWQQAAASKFVISEFFEMTLGAGYAKLATGLILFIAFSSLFAVMLGYSRIPYAAALDGNYFSIFGKIHPKGKFPYVSLLILGGIAFIFSLTLRLKEVITAIITMRILIQFISQAVGVILLHYRKPKVEMPFKMPLFPIPAILGICVWLFVFFSSEMKYMVGALLVILSGTILYFAKRYVYS
ncbi:MAG: APC family permease [Chitinophagales bacterium]|nr:APC family permease [Chitinophagales bacterium]